jgi:hypothetical protein
MASRHSLDPDSPLRAAPERSIGLSLNDPISMRVDQLVDLIEQHGERTTRKELVAALILAAGSRPQELGDALRGYRRALVRDAFLDPALVGSAVRLPPRKPGPRPRLS